MFFKHKLALLTLFYFIGTAPSAVAQLTPDNTLGAESSLIDPNATLNGLPTQLIEGGAARGSSLFHSFSDFNVGNLQRVYFSNPAGIANILTRVTGSNASNILGTLGVNGTANLFLINPNGILFGENAQLDISGSFLATTADSLMLDNYEFSATNPTSPPLLTLNVTPGLQYGANDPSRKIENAGNLSVGAGQKLTLFGGTVNHTGTLNAPGGTIEVLGESVNLLEQANIDVSSENGGGIVLIGGDYQGNGIVPNARETFVGENVVINADALSNGNGGRVIVWADETTQFYGTINARGGLNGGDGGFVEVSGLQALNFRGYVNALAPNGNPGILLLDPTDITIDNVDAFFISIAGANVILQADRNINFNASITMFNPGVGLTAEAGNNINLNNFIITNGGDVAFEAGNDINLNFAIFTDGGDVTLIADADRTGQGSIRTVPLAFLVPPGFLANLLMSNILFNGSILTEGGNIVLQGQNIEAGRIRSMRTTDGGNGGNVTLNAVENVAVAEIISIWEKGTTMGNGGDITVNAGGDIIIDHPVTNGGDVQSFSQDGRGGDIVLNAGGNIYTDDVQSMSTVSSGDITITSGGIFDQTIFGGTASSITACSGALNTCAGGRGSGGNITIEAMGGAVLSTLATTAPFGSGDISVASSNGAIEFRGQILASGDNGRGNITLQAKTEIIRPPNSFISRVINASGSGAGGNITLISQEGDFLLENDSIFSNARGQANGGDIFIQANSVTLINSNINSTASGNGRAGRITISTPGAFNLDRSRLLTSLEPGAVGAGGDIDISAGSVSLTNSSFLDTVTSGVGDAGEVTVRANEIALENSSIFSFTNGQGNSGKIDLQADVLSLSNRSNIATVSSASAIGNGGNVAINSRIFNLTGGAQVQTLTRGDGNAGSIQLGIAEAMRVEGISADGFLSGVFSVSEASSRGRGGDINFRGSYLTIGRGGVFSAETASAFDGGDISVQTNVLELLNGGQLLTNTFGSGSAGNIAVRSTERVLISGVDSSFTPFVAPPPLPRQNVPIRPPGTIAEVESNNFHAEAMHLRDEFFALDAPGNLNANVEFSSRIPYVSIAGQANDNVDIYSFNVVAGTRATFDIDDGFKDAGLTDVDIRISLFDSQGNLLASNIRAPGTLGGAGTLQNEFGGGLSPDPYLKHTFGSPGTYFLAVDTSRSNSPAATYQLQVSLETVDVAGLVANRVPASGLFVRTQGTGSAGNVTISTPQLSVRDGGQISGTTSGFGEGGGLEIYAPESFEVSNGAGLFFDSRGAGNARGIRINTGDLRVENGGQISVSGSGTGISGDLEITANSIFLNNQGLLRATTAASQGGNIRLTVAKDIVLRHNSEISAEAFGAANGGNITFNVGRFIWAILSENSDIVAGAVEGNGGRIEGSAQGIFGFRQFRDRRTSESDFTASSEFGIDGIVDINLRNSPSVDPLPSDFLSSGLAEGCLADNGKPLASLVNTGRGGMPETPYDPLTSDDIWEDVQPPKSWSENASEPLVEAQGWVVNETGNVVLVAEIPSSRVGCGSALREPVQSLELIQ